MPRNAVENARGVEFDADDPADVLRAARKALGMSQARFAELIETPVATLRDWEQGRYRPPGSVMVLCLIALKNPDALLSVA